MILISTLRKMIQKNRDAKVIRVTIAAHQGRLSTQTFEYPEVTDYFATDRQANEFWAREAEACKMRGADPAKLIRVANVPALEVAKMQGFEY